MGWRRRRGGHGRTAIQLLRLWGGGGADKEEWRLIASELRPDWSTDGHTDPAQVHVSKKASPTVLTTFTTRRTEQRTSQQPKSCERNPRTESTHEGATGPVKDFLAELQCGELNVYAVQWQVVRFGR